MATIDWELSTRPAAATKQAAHYYRQVIDFVRAHPDQYEPEFETTFHKLVQTLDPPSTN